MESRTSGTLGSPRIGGQIQNTAGTVSYLCEKVQKLQVRRIGIDLDSNLGERGKEVAARKTKESQTLVIWLLFRVSGKDTKRQISIKDQSHSTRMKFPTTLWCFLLSGILWNQLNFEAHMTFPIIVVLLAL